MNNNNFDNSQDIIDSQSTDNTQQKHNKKHSNGLGKSLFSTAAKCVATCAVLGLTVGFVIPMTTDYIIPKFEASLTDKLNTTVENSITASDMTDYNAITSNTNLDEASANMVSLIKNVKPSIVCINSITQATNFFNQTFESEGSGSGILFYKDSQNAYIATNAHVISGASKVTVSVEDNDPVYAALVGKDANADLAVISVSLSDLAGVGVNNVQLASFGDSTTLQVGEQVIAIGNALGQGNTATAGIVSALQKNVVIEGRKLNVIQTDAAINPGNSGGALINSKGEVIGINTAKLAVTAVEGIGFSIESNIAKPIIEQLMNSTDTPALGVNISDITEEMASAYDLPQAGVLVAEIVPNGSAANSELQVNDIITGFNNQPIFNSDQLISAIRNSKVGDTVTLKILRNNETKTISVTLQKSITNGF